MKLVECVPNISEGRRQDVIDRCVAEVRAVPGVTVFDVSSDADHNRTVITYVGEPEAAGDAAVRLAKKAVELIDLNHHIGGHPRMGAVDVIPFVPVKEVTVEEAVALSKRVAEAVWKECGLPVFLYEDSASAPGRQNLAAIRKGQFEGMPEKLLLPEWAPDFGERKIHPTAGVCAVGARMPLVAFNIDLSTGDVEIANAIARIIRKSSGGLDCVKAMGVHLEERSVAQVSINMTNYRKTPLYRVLELVRAEARRWGVTVTGTEIVGLAPMSALIETAEYYLQLERFDEAKQILENHLL